MATEPYIGEIRLFGGTFAPYGWALCDGQVMAISQNSTLFNLIGTTYGGDGVTTFALPDLRGRVPVHQGTLAGSSFVVGQMAGEETVTLTVAQLPQHAHALGAQSGPGTTGSPAGAFPASRSGNPFSDQAATGSMAPTILSSTGGGQAHDNVVPFLAVSFIISLLGVYPSQN